MVSANGIYSYTVSYDAVGNIAQFQDATYNNGTGVMGTCPSDLPSRVKIADRPINVLELSSYEYRGHVFAYRVYFAAETRLHDDTRVETGSVSTVFFIDVDGSGHFTCGFLLIPITIPG